MSITAVNPSTATTATTAKKDDAGSADRFLKLLVAQMQNQDPLNPMDNAQVTSQMAQINTVNGIEKLNTTVQGLSSQFTQLQAMQSTSLVGRDVVVPGNRLDINDGVGQGGFQLDGPADNVKVEILSSGGVVVDTINLGAQSSGMSSFNWPAGQNTNQNNLSFRVIARSGTNPVTHTPLMRDRVDAVSTAGNAINLQLQNSGQVAYGDVRAFN
ncbi:MAG: flagellar hook assembly protein FlgD [Burkholderiales bacterium]